jgi:tRNA A58 N-methylase Trm61
MEAIVPSGKLLDIGCANGLLMKCFKEWSGGSIDPYGVDTNKTTLAAGRQIFPEFQDHLLTPQEFLATQAGHLSTKYSTVYWNVWDSFALDTADAKQKINNFLALLSPHGRLVLGFYNPTIEEIQKKIRKLQTAYRRPDGIVHAGHGRPETAVFFTTSP